MGISLREWLIIGGVLIIVLILIDGWRRIRASRSRLRIDIDKSLSEIGDTTQSNPELPNGGARVRFSENEPYISDTLYHPIDEETKPTQPNPPVHNYTAEDFPFNSGSVETAGIESTEVEIAVVESATFETAIQDAAILESGAENKDNEVPQVETQPLHDAVIQEEVADLTHLDEEIDSDVEPPLLSWDTIDDRQYADLDPLFDDIPTAPYKPLPETKNVMPSVDNDHPNLYLDLDLDQPIHQIMANKAAASNAKASIDKETNAKEHKEKETKTHVKTKADKDSGHKHKHKNKHKDKDKAHSNESVNVSKPIDTLYNPLVNDLFADSEQRLPSHEHASHQQSSDEHPLNESHDSRANLKDADKSRSAASAARKILSDLPDPEEVLVITVVGKDRQFLDGEKLKRVVEACGMEYGDMSIYHRFEGEGSTASLQFSMANAVNPGTFDPEAMSRLETPAVSFFMAMRESQDPMTAYECMLATAETLAKHLLGDLLDEDRSVMREQTKEHYRQRIRDFEMQSRRRKFGR